MTWLEIASEVFGFRKWAAVVVLLLYVVPVLRIVTAPVSLGRPFCMFFNRQFGRCEHAVAWFRDTVVAAYLVLFGLWHVSFGVDLGDRARALLGAAALLLVGVSIINAYMKRAALKRLIAFAARFPKIHPKEFFHHLLCSAGAFRHRLPEAPYHTIDPAHLDFRTGKGRRVPLTNVISGVWSTIWCAKLCLMAFKWRGREFLREAASSIGVIWGTRMAFLVRAEVMVEDIHRLDDITGFNIYVFNHMSFLDFAMVPVAMAARHHPLEKRTNDLPRFLVAKDHFLDNPVFHRMLGMGMVAEETGMVFVDRREREADAKAVIEESAVKLVRDGIDFAIFPQGTRAKARFAANGTRMDAGYYAVGRPARMKRDGDHIKKGAAHLATCAALILRTEGIEADVNIVPVAIKGTSIAAPRESLKMEPNVTIHLKVGEPIVVRPSEVKGIEDNAGQAYLDFVRRLHMRIDNGLKAAFGIHVELERRFFEDMMTMAEPLDIEEMAIALKPWRGEDYLVHAVLDCIYTCKPRHWYGLLGRLMYLIRNDAARNDLLAFKGEVVDLIAT